MKNVKFLFVACLFTLSLNSGLTAQTQIELVPVNYMQEELKGILDQLNGSRSSNECKDVYLIFPEDPHNLGFKKPLLLGEDVKPLMEENLTGDGTKKVLLSAVGDAVQCAPICASELLNDWYLEGANVLGSNITFGPFTKIVPKQPGKYIFIGMTPEQCFVVDVNAVICKPDTVYITEKITETLVINFQAVTTGVNEEVDFDDLHVFPNPLLDELTISHSENEVLIKVYDLSGNQTLLSQHVGPMEKIDFTQFVPGTYIIEASAIKEGVVVRELKKIVKQ